MNRRVITPVIWVNGYGEYVLTAKVLENGVLVSTLFGIIDNANPEIMEF